MSLTPNHTHTGVPAVYCQPRHTLISSRSTRKDTPRITFFQVSVGHQAGERVPSPSSSGSQTVPLQGHSEAPHAAENHTSLHTEPTVPSTPDSAPRS